MRWFWLAVCCCLLPLSTFPMYAAGKNIADYPLRIHIFSRSETNFYHWRSMDASQGEGRANLFENGDVRGVDFRFQCSEKLQPSFGHETYPARWKKSNQELEVLFPVFGKTNAYWTCNLDTDVKDFAYGRNKNGRMFSESPAQYKAWMVQHDYDPEHGKDTPVFATKPPEPPRPAQPPSPGTNP